MTRKKTDEVTVAHAADFLGVTSRTVLNYIQAKEIEAIKVGKSWYIKAPSLDAFAQRFGLGGNTTNLEKTSNTTISTPLSPQKGIREKKSKFKKENSQGKNFSVKDLHAFKVATEIFLELDSITNLVQNVHIQNKMKVLYYEAMEYLGAGYYSFEAYNKKQLYNKSREKVGGILSLLYAHQNESFHESPPSVIRKIEDDLLPAFSGLIRKMDRASNKKTSQSNTKEGNIE